MPSAQVGDATQNQEVFLIRDPNTDAFVQVSKARFLVNQFFQGDVFGVPKRSVAFGVAGISLAALVLWWMRSRKAGAAGARRPKKKGRR
jgi:uncharacterized iron-regulated membrane protein